MGKSTKRTNRNYQGDPPSSLTSNIRVSTQAGVIETQAGNIESLTRRNEELIRSSEEELAKMKEELTGRIEELTRMFEEVTRKNEELTRMFEEATRKNEEIARSNEELKRTNDGQKRTIDVLTTAAEIMQSRVLEGNNRIPVHPTTRQQAAQFQNAPVTPVPPLPPNFLPSPDGEDGSGGIYQNTLEENISNLSAQGSILISEILAELRQKGAFRALKRWNPRREEARRVLGRLLEKILSPEYLHLFSEESLFFTSGKDSVWRTIVSVTLTELTTEKQTSWVRYLARVAKDNPVFREFITNVVRVRNRFCT